MSRALLQTVNPAVQAVAENGIIAPGTVVRRYGCNIQLSGNGQEISGEGYYRLDGTVTVEPTAIGNVSVSLLENGVQIPGGIASGYASAADVPVTLPLVCTVRKQCGCAGASSITCVLTEGAGNVTNYSLRIAKD